MNDDCVLLLEQWSLAKAFDLPPNSTVFVIGAYQGLAMELLSEVYHPRHLVGFEPQLWAVEAATKRLNGRSYTLFPAGLGIEKGTFPMGEYHTDGCSFVNTGPESRTQGEGQLWDADETLLVLNPSKIDLMIMNIEGYEWYLLPYLQQKGWLGKIDRLAVQWHYDLGEDPMSDKDVSRYVDNIEQVGLKLNIDLRPAWTYFVRNNVQKE